jgi:RNA polymerase subunit RPABC4/transcription elongation factor Spt4
MATFRCPDCKRWVSKTAQSCPGCGREVTPGDGKFDPWGCGCLIIIIVFFIAVFTIIGNPNNSKNNPGTSIVKEYYNAINNGNFSKAFNLRSERLKSLYSLESCSNGWKGKKFTITSTRITSQSEGRTEINIVLSTLENKKNVNSSGLICIVKENGRWKIDDLEIK